MKTIIPWEAKKPFHITIQHINSLLSRLARRDKNLLSICFYCKYHNITGSTVAIASIANNLARYHNVDVYIEPLSGYSRLLNRGIRQYFSPDRMVGTIVFVDIEQESRNIEALLHNNKRVILSCHALPTILHNVPQDKLARNLELCSNIHFVSNYQRSAFIEHFPDIDIEEKSFWIPNYTRQSSKSNRTGNVGIIGHSNRPVKNTLKAIQLAQKSDAKSVQCWGSDSVAGLKDISIYSKLVINGWADSIETMHLSFDVLISTSKFETFGLVVVEALSAGIPCLLSDIPVFRELFSGCEGVVFLTGNDKQDIESINYLLANTPTLKKNIIEFWESNFSNDTITTQWLSRLETLAHQA